MKNIPNILSLSRLIISGLLFFIGNHPILFTILYIYCGISDIADGYIARRWKVESTIGGKLDSLGDFVFYILITTVLFTYTYIMKDYLVLWLVICIFAIKLLNLIITKIKFHQWGMMHTIGNKLSGLLIYIMPPMYILFPVAPVTLAVIIVFIALIATIEETLILFYFKDYNLNRKGIFDLMLYQRKGEI